MRLAHDDRRRAGLNRYGHAILGSRVAARLARAAARDAPARPAALAEPAVVAPQREQAAARADARLDTIGDGEHDGRRPRAYAHGDVACRFGKDQPRRGGARVHPYVCDPDVGEIDVELSRPGVHIERRGHVARDLDLDVDGAAASEEPLRTNLIDPHVGAAAALRRPQAEIGVLAVRAVEVRRAAADVVAAGATVDREHEHARAAPRNGHIGLASAATPSEREDPAAETR